MNRVTLKWDAIHEQSREQLCEASCVRLEVARLKWDEIEKWLQDILRHNHYGFGIE